MVTISNNKPVSNGPREITSDNVQYWCRHTKELKNTQISKAKKLVKNHCIRYIGNAFEENNNFKKLKNKYPNANHIFVCLPLNTKTKHEFLGITMLKEPYEKDYNNSEYIIYKKPDGTFECNCQGYQSKKKRNELVENGANCSHILALFYSFKMKRFNKQHGASSEHSQIDF